MSMEMDPSFEAVAWSYGSNVYEINTRQYTPEGTFGAFANHLPRLQEMGVEVLWFMPVTPVSREGRLGILGSYYACSSYTSINPEFGTMEDFKALVIHAHKLGFKVIIDWVANHTGRDHPWIAEHPDWYDKDEDGNFTEKHGWEDVYDLNYNSPELRTAMIESMQFWIRECDIDGFRCDMAHLVPLDFWMRARKECDQLKHLFWLAECDVEKYHAVFDVSYAWEWMHVTEKLVKQIATFQHFKDVLSKYSYYPPSARKLFFTTNHDENSWNGTEYDKYGSAAKAMAIFTCTWPGMPLIYSGQELPNLKQLKFFEKDFIDWNEPVALNQFYRSLLLLRRKSPAFEKDAAFIKLSTTADDRVLAYLLLKEKSKVLIILNLSPSDKTKCRIADSNLNGRYYNLFSGLYHNINESENFELQAWEYIVYVNV